MQRNLDMGIIVWRSPPPNPVFHQLVLHNIFAPLIDHDTHIGSMIKLAGWLGSQTRWNRLDALFVQKRTRICALHQSLTGSHSKQWDKKGKATGEKWTINQHWLVHIKRVASGSTPNSKLENKKFVRPFLVGPKSLLVQKIPLCWLQVTRLSQMYEKWLKCTE